MVRRCHDCGCSKLLIKGLAVSWICKKSGHHKTFADTCDLTKRITHPHPFLGTLDGYIEAARCKVLTEFQADAQK